MAVRLPPSGWFVPAILVALCVCATAQQTPVSLTYGESRATSASGSGKLFSVNVPADASGPYVLVTSNSWMEDDWAVYVYDNVPSGGFGVDQSYTCYTGTPEDGGAFDDTEYRCQLQPGTLNYVWVDLSSGFFGSSFTIETGDAANTAIVGILVVVAVVIVALFCAFFARKGLRPSMNTSTKIVHNNYLLCTILTASMMIAPIVLIIVGLTAPITQMQYTMGGVGTALFVCFAFWLGHTSVSIDGEKQHVEIVKRYCYVYPVIQVYPFSEIQCFSMSSQLSTKGRVLYAMGMDMVDGRRISIDTGNSNIDISGRRARCQQFNELLQRYKPAGTVPMGVETGIGAVFGVAGALAGAAVASQVAAQQAAASQAAAATQAAQQQQLLMQQQMILHQQQQLAAMRAGGAGGTINPAFGAAGFGGGGAGPGGPGYPHGPSGGMPMPMMPGAGIGGAPAASAPPADSTPPPQNTKSVHL